MNNYNYKEVVPLLQVSDFAKMLADKANDEIVIAVTNGKFSRDLIKTIKESNKNLDKIRVIVFCKDKT